LNVRRALAAVATGSAALAGVAVIGLAVAQAATVAPTSLSITAPHQVTYGQPAKVTGDLTNTVMAAQPATMRPAAVGSRRPAGRLCRNRLAGPV
jgi:hypothetical protein